MESIKELRKIAQPKAAQYPIIQRFYKVFSIYITRIFLSLGLKPNSVTLLGFLTGIIGGYLYIAQHFVWGSIFFLLFYFLDNVDGEVARYRKLVSKFGGWLDVVAGHLLYPYFFLTLGMGVFFQTGIFWYFLLGAVGAVAKLIERSVPRVLTDERTESKNQEMSSNSLKEWLGEIGKFSAFFLVILFCALIGWEKWFLWFFAIYLLLFALGKFFLTGRRIYRYNH